LWLAVVAVVLVHHLAAAVPVVLEPDQLWL
jgi:hypothetical protein